MKSSLHRLIVPLLLGVLTACSGQKAPEANPAPTLALDSQVVEARTVRKVQQWDGVVEAVNRVTLAAQTNARVSGLPFDVNDVVAKGDVLVRFTDVEQKSAERAAQARVAEAEAVSSEAQKAYERTQSVYAKKLVAQAQLDQARARRDAARAALAAARAERERAGQSLDYTVLRAPFAGVVTQRFVEVGQAVQAGPPSPQPLIEMQSLEALRVNVVVPQEAAAAIRKLQSAEVLVGAAGTRIRADAVEVFPYADPATHSFRVRLHLPDGSKDLFPGMTVKVAFALGSGTRLSLPASALQRQGELAGVYVLDAHGVQLRQLRLGQRDGNQVEVLAGLDAGERIASDPAAAARWLVEQRRNSDHD